MALLPTLGTLLALVSSPGLELEPSSIDIGMFYGGTTITAETTVEPGGDVVVICHGQPGPVDVKVKGKVWGILWMNVGEASFESIPAAYLLASTAPLSQLADAHELQRLGVGYPALLGPQTEPSGTDVFDDFVALRESEELFAAHEGVLKVEESADGAHVTARMFLPAKAPPGEYLVEVFRFAGGAGERVRSTTLQVTQVGTAEFITQLAHEHGLLYGIAAVVIALIVGLLTGLVFGLGSKGGH